MKKEIFMERFIEFFNGNIVWLIVFMVKIKKSNYVKINIVNVRKVFFKNKLNYGCNDVLVDNWYIYLFWRIKELMFCVLGFMNLLLKGYRWIFYENGLWKIDMKILIEWFFL